MKRRRVSAPMGAAWCRGASGRRATGGRNAASATDLLRQPATVTHCLGPRFLAHRERQGSKEARQAGCPGVPGLSAPAGWPRALG